MIGGGSVGAMQPFDQLAEIYQNVHSDNPAQAALIDRIAALILPGSSVLDLGCGTGVPTAANFIAAGHRVIGVDIAEGMLRHAREQVPAAEFVRADVKDLPADYGTYDAVTAFFCLLMLSKADIEKTLQKVAGWVRPGGYFGLSMVEFDADSMPVEFLGVPVQVSGYLPADLRVRLQNAGFHVLSLESVEFVPPQGPPEQQIFALCQVPAAA